MKLVRVLEKLDVEGEVAYIFWPAPPLCALATDTFVVHNGKIIVQTFAVLSSHRRNDAINRCAALHAGRPGAAGGYDWV